MQRSARHLRVSLRIQKYGSSFALAWNFLNQRSTQSVGRTSTPFVLDGRRQLFMYRLGDELRIVYEMAGDGVVIRDILSREFAGRQG